MRAATGVLGSLDNSAAFMGGARTRACRVETRLDACTGPRVLPRIPHNTCFDRIVFDISANPAQLNLIPYPVIVGFFLPKWLPGSTQQTICLPGGRTLERFQQAVGRDHRSDQEMNMICHNDVRAQL